MRAALPFRCALAAATSLLLGCRAQTASEVEDTPAATTAASESSGAAGVVVASLHGGVEKGPLLLGSSITASRLDATGSPTGQLYASQIADDSGTFSIGEVPIGIYLLEGVGYHFDEVSGELGHAPITLRAVVELDEGGAPVFVNVFSHLAHRRVLTMIGDGVEISAALDQAEAELLAALPIGPPGLDQDPVGATNSSLLGGDSVGARLLLAASAVFIAAARSTAADATHVDAELQQLLHRGAEDLGDDGALDGLLTAQLEAGLLALDPAGIEDHLRARLLELGLAAEPPDLDAVLDQDRDGFINASDVCPTAVDPDQVDSDADGLGDPCDVLPFGPAEIVLDGLVAPYAFVVHPDWVYLFESGLADQSGEISRLSRADGSIEVLRRGIGFGNRPVVTDTALFWHEPAGILTANLDGSAMGVFWPDTGGAFAADATHLYNASGAIQRRPLSGGATEVLSAEFFLAIFGDLAVGAGGAVYSDEQTIRYIDVSGQDGRKLAGGFTSAPMLAVDDTAAYWVDRPACTLRRAALADGAQNVLWSPEDANLACYVPVHPALAGEFVYWATHTAIYRARRDDGSELRIIALDGPESPVNYPFDLQIDATHVWWINPYVGEEPSATGQLVRTRIP